MGLISRKNSKRRLITLLAAVVLTAVILILVLVVYRSRKPRLIAGQPVVHWVLQAYSGNSNAVTILKEEGTNIIPEALSLLRSKDSRLQKEFWAENSSIPMRLRRMFAKTVPYADARNKREAAAAAFGMFGPDARAAIPDLAVALRDPQGLVSTEAAKSLAKIGKESVPELNTALKDPDPVVRRLAAGALGDIGPGAASALPTLLGALSDTNGYVRSRALASILNIQLPRGTALVREFKHDSPAVRKSACEQTPGCHLVLQRIHSTLTAEIETEKANQLSTNPIAMVEALDKLLLSTLSVAINDSDQSVRDAASRAQDEISKAPEKK